MACNELIFGTEFLLYIIVLLLLIKLTAVVLIWRRMDRFEALLNTIHMNQAKK